MVIKTLSRKSGSAGVINYLFKKEEKLFEKDNKPLIIRHNVRGRKQETWIKEFEKNEQFRLHKRKQNVKAYHSVLSFSKKDKEYITRKLLKDIAKEYIKLRGKDALYIGTAHGDKDHIHLHLVESGTKYMTGLANRMTKAEFAKLKLLMDEYQKEKYPELIHSLPRHGLSKEKQVQTKARQTDRENRQVDTRATQKEALIRSLETAYCKALSLDSFLTDLTGNGYTPYYRGEKLQGLTTDTGRKFRFSTLGYGKEELEQLERISKEEEKDLADLRSIRNQAQEEREKEDMGRSLVDDFEPHEDDEPNESGEDDEPH